MEEFSTERKAAEAIAKWYKLTSEELRQNYYSFSELIDAYWIGYMQAVKESRP